MKAYLKRNHNGRYFMSWTWNDRIFWLPYPERIQLVGMKEWSYSSRWPLTIVTKFWERCSSWKHYSYHYYAWFGDQKKCSSFEEKANHDLAVKKFQLVACLVNYQAGRFFQKEPVSMVSWWISAGMGVLIQGDSGIGKSETAWASSNEPSFGSRRPGRMRSSPVMRWPCGVSLLEIRQFKLEIQIGIIDVMSLMELCCGRRFLHRSKSRFTWKIGRLREQPYDRLGNNAEETEFCEWPFQEFASLLRQALHFRCHWSSCIIHRAKENGYDATKTFEDRLTQLIDQMRWKYESSSYSTQSFSILLVCDLYYPRSPFWQSSCLWKKHLVKG